MENNVFRAESCRIVPNRAESCRVCVQFIIVNFFSVVGVNSNVAECYSLLVHGCGFQLL